MKDFKHKTYYHPKGCGPLALRQLCDAPDNDVLSAAILNGYDPVEGGMTPLGFRAAAQQLGIRLGRYGTPRKPMCVAQFVELSKHHAATFVIGVGDHVFVIRKGQVIDPINTPPWELVDVVAKKEN